MIDLLAANTTTWPEVAKLFIGAAVLCFVLWLMAWEHRK
jgi:hypothetical protein